MFTRCTCLPTCLSVCSQTLKVQSVSCWLAVSEWPGDPNQEKFIPFLLSEELMWVRPSLCLSCCQVFPPHTQQQPYQEIVYCLQCDHKKIVSGTDSMKIAWVIVKLRAGRSWGPQCLFSLSVCVCIVCMIWGQGGRSGRWLDTRCGSYGKITLIIFQSVLLWNRRLCEALFCNFYFYVFIHCNVLAPPTVAILYAFKYIYFLIYA